MKDKIIASIAKWIIRKEEKKGLKPLSSAIYAKVETSIQISEHFIQRSKQRFDEMDLQSLTQSVVKAIKGTKPLERYDGSPLILAQRFIDKETNFVVVLERIGMYGARLVTCYKHGILDEEGDIG